MLKLFKNKNILAAIAIVAVAGLAYYIWSSQGASSLLTSSTAGSAPGSQEILATLGQLNTIKLDPALFTDPVFASLSDFGVTIPPEAAGRRNPFAPVGSDQSSAGASGAGSAGQ